jgi:hypothetical protein
MHIYLEIAAAVLVIVPLFAVARAYRGTRSPRLLFAFAAFAFLEVMFAFLVTVHSVVSVNHFIEETFEFLTDLMAIAMFAAAFMYAMRWSPDRGRAELA